MRGSHDSLSQLLRLVQSLRDHSHTSPSESSDTAASSGSPPSFTCPCRTLILHLCRWMAARVELRSGDHAELLTFLATRQQHRITALPVKREEVEKEMKSSKSTAAAVRSLAAVPCTIDCLLFPLELDKKALQCKSSESSTREDSIRALFHRLESERAATSPRCAMDGETEDCSITTVRDVWEYVASNTAMLSHPVSSPQNQVLCLVELYVETSTEQAAHVLLYVLSARRHTLSAQQKCDAVSFAFHTLLRAQHAAHAAADHFNSTVCRAHLETRIRPLLVSLLSSPAAATPGRRAATFWRQGVEVHADPLKTVSGRGLVATAAMVEGTLLVQEEALCTRRSDANGGADQLTEALHRVLSSVPGTDTVRTIDDDAVDDDDQLWSRFSLSAPDASSVHRGGDMLAAFLVKRLRAQPLSYAGAWWLRWAVLLPPERSDIDSIASSAAADEDTDMRACVTAAVLQAGVHHTQGAQKATAATATSLQEPASAAALDASVPHGLTFLPVREVDEFRFPPPPSQLSTGHGKEAYCCGQEPASPHALLPQVNPSVSDALFCLLHFVNHSCAPNALVVFDTVPAEDASTRVVGSLVALRDIEPGEELTISYVPATTALTVSAEALTRQLGFACRCSLCAQKGALRHGVWCRACQQLIWEPHEGDVSDDEHAGTALVSEEEKGEEEETEERAIRKSLRSFATTTTARTTSVFRHSESCTASKHAVHAVERQLSQQLDRITVELSSGAADSLSDASASKDAKAKRSVTPSIRYDPLVQAVRQLVDLDALVAHSLLPTHHLRLRLRLEAFAYSTAAAGLGSTVSAALIELTAHTLEELELLLCPNHPLLSGLRMYLVFSRGRHVRAVQAAAALEDGARHADCCGAVREQTALMRLPFVLDALVRRCVARCFQEHFAQLVEWRLPPGSTEEAVLLSFLQRYPVELEAAGITQTEHVALLSCMEEDAAETAEGEGREG